MSDRTLEDRLAAAVLAAHRRRMAHDEAEIHRMACLWVSGLEPVLAYDHRGNLMGLTHETDIGSVPTIAIKARPYV